MGGDGGSVPKRKERVKTSEVKQQVLRAPELDANEQWKICAISGNFIRRPVLAAPFGHLVCKEGLLEFLIELKNRTIRSYDILEDTNPVCNAIKSTKSVKELKLKDNPALNKDQPSDEEWMKGDFVCPITGLETNGKHKFVFSWQCGCVISERALKECAQAKEVQKCLLCEVPYNECDIVVINPKGKDIERNQAAFLARSMRSHIKGKDSAVVNPSSSSHHDSRKRRETDSGKEHDASQAGTSSSSSSSLSAPGPSHRSTQASSSNSKRNHSVSSRNQRSWSPPAKRHT